MLKYFFALAYVLFSLSSSEAGEPFQCHIFTQNKLVDRWVSSVPMQGHGMQHFASDSFEHQGLSYYFDGQSHINSNLVSVRVSVRIHLQQYVAMANNSLFFSALNVDGISIECKNLK